MTRPTDVLPVSVGSTTHQSTNTITVIHTCMYIYIYITQTSRCVCVVMWLTKHNRDLVWRKSWSLSTQTCQKPADVDWNKYCQSESITAVFSSATVCWVVRENMYDVLWSVNLYCGQLTCTMVRWPVCCVCKVTTVTQVKNIFTFLWRDEQSRNTNIISER